MVVWCNSFAFLPRNSPCLRDIAIKGILSWVSDSSESVNKIPRALRASLVEKSGVVGWSSWRFIILVILSTFSLHWNCRLVQHVCQIHFFKGSFSHWSSLAVRRRSNSSRILLFPAFVVFERPYAWELAPVILDRLGITFSPSQSHPQVLIIVSLSFSI